jgi:hypothetical protein
MVFEREEHTVQIWAEQNKAEAREQAARDMLCLQFPGIKRTALNASPGLWSLVIRLSPTTLI